MVTGMLHFSDGSTLHLYMTPMWMYIFNLLFAILGYSEHESLLILHVNAFRAQ